MLWILAGSHSSLSHSSSTGYRCNEAYPDFPFVSEIIMAGDSAGGHLAAGLLSHLNHPSEEVEPVKLAEPLRAMCFISPFLGFDYNKES
jgi:hypothetical protein